MPVLNGSMYSNTCMRPLTESVEIAEAVRRFPVVDEPSLGEKSEGVKQLEDGVARLVDGHHNNTTAILVQTKKENITHPFYTRRNHFTATKPFRLCFKTLPKSVFILPNNL